jgi:hypothetical protein
VNRDLLVEFMLGFYGYGNWSAKYWFVGMEEGGGSTIDEAASRIEAWDRSTELADLYEFHRAIGNTSHFEGRAPIQRTWGRLIATALAAEQRPADRETVRDYQRTKLGRRDGDTALIELFPLPSPSTKHWIYEECHIIEIASRQAYRTFLANTRVSTIRDRIRRHRPQAVVLYGNSYRAYWETIAGMSFSRQRGEPFQSAQLDSSILVLAPHPVARGIATSDFTAIGDWIAGESRVRRCSCRS